MRHLIFAVLSGIFLMSCSKEEAPAPISLKWSWGMSFDLWGVDSSTVYIRGEFDKPVDSAIISVYYGSGFAESRKTYGQNFDFQAANKVSPNDYFPIISIKAAVKGYYRVGVTQTY